MAVADYTGIVEQLYVSYFGRPADSVGLTNFATALNDMGAPTTIAAISAQAQAGDAALSSLINSFTTSTESINQFGTGTSLAEADAFVAAIFQQVLNRAPTVTGLDNFWVKAIVNNELTLANASLQISAGALVNTSAQGLLDAKAVANKVAVATNFTAAIDTPAEVTAFKGAAAAADAKALLAQVTDTTDVVAFQATVESTLATIVAHSVPGQTFTLTTGVDAIVGTSGNDTITGDSTTLAAGDVILDQSTTDNDTLNLTLTAVNALATVTGIENVNVNWNAFGTANYDADNTTGATITGTSTKTGFLGSFTVDNTGANNVVAGAGMTGTLQVNLATDTTVTGTAAKVVNVDGSATREDNVAAVVTAGASTTTVNVGATNGFDSVTVTGGAATTSVTVDDAAAITVDAAAATTVTLDGTAETDDTATVTLGVDADVVLGATEEIETVTINAADGITVDITGSDIKNLTVASAGAVTLVAAASELTTNTVTNAADSLNVEVDHDGAADLSKVAADLITLTSTNATALTFATGANVLVAEDVDLDAGASFVGKSATTGTLNLTVLADQTNDIAVTTLKTLNLTVELNADDADDVATLGGITSANDVTLTSANDVVVTALAVKNLDASASTGDLTVTQNFATADLVSLVGSQGNNDVTLDSVDAEVSVVAGEGDDKVTLGTAAATAEVTLVLGNGDNEIDAGTFGIDGADLSIVTGTGDDVVSATLINGVNFVAELGAGVNELTLDSSDNGAAQNITIVTGAGNDSLIFAGATDATDTINWTAGAGTNTIDLNGQNISAGTFTLSGVTNILDSDGAGVVDGSLLKGQTYTIQGDGSLATQLDVTIATAGSYNFSGLVLDNTLANGIGGLDVTGSGGNDTIIGTAGADAIATNGGNDTITGGKGQDTITLGAGDDTVVIASGDAGKTAATIDIINDFLAAGTDVLKLGTAGSATNYTEVDLASGGASTVANALTAAGLAMDGTVRYVLIEDSTAIGGEITTADSILFIDFNLDGTVDAGVKLVGNVAADLVFGDIIA